MYTPPLSDSFGAPSRQTAMYPCGSLSGWAPLDSPKFTKFHGAWVSPITSSLSGWVPQKKKAFTLICKNCSFQPYTNQILIKDLVSYSMSCLIT